MSVNFPFDVEGDQHGRVDFGPGPRMDHEAVVVQPSRLLIWGGRSARYRDTGDRETTYLFPRNVNFAMDLQSRQWFKHRPRSVSGTVPPPCFGARAVCIGRYVYSFGGKGYDSDGKMYFLNDLYRLDVEKMEWYLVPVSGEKPQGRARCTMCQSGDRLVLQGGFWSPGIYEYMSDCDWVDDAWEFVLATSSWARLYCSYKSLHEKIPPTDDHICFSLDDSFLLFQGGHLPSKIHHGTVFLLDSKKQEWLPVLEGQFGFPVKRGHVGVCIKRQKMVYGFALGGLINSIFRDQTYAFGFVFDLSRRNPIEGITPRQIQLIGDTSALKGIHHHTACTLDGPTDISYIILYGGSYEKFSSYKVPAATDQMIILKWDQRKPFQLKVMEPSENILPVISEESIYQKALDSGTIMVERMRLMFVGQDRSGKTSLINSLLDKPFNQNVPSTDGVAIGVAVTDVEKWTEQKDADGCFLDECIQRGFQKVKQDAENVPLTPTVSEREEEKYKPEPSRSKPIEVARGDTLPETRQQDKKGKEKKPSKLPTERVMRRALPSPEFAVLLKLSKGQMDSVLRYINTASKLSEMENLQIIHLWDLGGQETYLSTHCSLLPGSITNTLTAYVLVVNLAVPLANPAMSAFRYADGTSADCTTELQWIERNEDFMRVWLSNFSTAYPLSLQQVQPHIGEAEDVANPPVFVAGTHYDLQEAKDIVETQNEAVAKIVEEKHYENHIVRPTSARQESNEYLFLIDNTKSGECGGVQSLRERIDQMRKGYYSRMKPQPFRWILLEFLVFSLKKSSPIIKKEFLIKLAIHLCGLADADEVNAALNHLGGLGIIFQFPETPSLADEIFINPEWVVDMLAVFVTAKRPVQKLMTAWRNVQKTGKMTKELVDHRLSAANVSKENHGIVLKLLNRLDIISPVQTSVISATEHCDAEDLFVPCLLTSKILSTLTLWEQSDASDPFPPPMTLVPCGIEAVPEALFFRLVNRFLRRYVVASNGLSRHRCLFETDLFLFELLFGARGRAVVLTVGGSPAKYLEDSIWVRRLSDLRLFFEEQVDDVRHPGMSLFNYEIGYYFGKPEELKCMAASESVYKLRRDPFEYPSVSPWLSNDNGSKPPRKCVDKVRLWLGKC